MPCVSQMRRQLTPRWAVFVEKGLAPHRVCRRDTCCGTGDARCAQKTVTSALAQWPLVYQSINMGKACWPTGNDGEP